MGSGPRPQSSILAGFLTSVTHNSNAALLLEPRHHSAFADLLEELTADLDGGLANAAKYYAAEVAFKTATQAVVTLGGMGYAKEYHVERLLRESLIPKLAPVSSQMILNYISEKILHLPRSY